ncbi:MAG: hypothetical protein QG632_565, partial [Candidatus Dependentiae bacterium]|nr:hypothetical protein [Candidatus Dependentiae bacterium]
MKLIYLIIGLAIALSHSPILAERSVPAIMIGVAGLGGFGYKGLSTYEKIRLLDRGIKILEMLVNGQVNGESAEELIALKSNLQSAKKRLMLYVVGGLVSALILAKGAVKGQRESAISSQVEGHDSDLVPSLQNLEKPELVSP